MKFAVTYVMVTHLTRRRAGKSKIEIVDTDDVLYVGVPRYDKARQPEFVERIFQASHRTQQAEAKVVDVRQVSELSQGERA